MAGTTTATVRLLHLLPNSIPHSKPPKPTPRLQLHPPTTRHLPQQLHHPAVGVFSKHFPLSAAAAAAAAVVFLDPQDALAVSGELGILEGRALSLIHPAVMASLFFYSLWAGYLGWQWRRVRTTQEEINELKKQVKPPALAAVPAGSDRAQEAAPPAAALSSVELKIQQLTEERKALLKGSYRDRHFNAGSILLGFGVFESVGGALNTWLRTGKLFPGPHLFAGAAITVLWASAAALVPLMQKGNDTARNLHIALNGLNVLLFIWQIPTGLEIFFKMLESTQWP